MLGDSILNLVVCQKAYCQDKCPKSLNRIREELADKEANKKVLNQDAVFRDFLGDKHVDVGPQGDIGKDKADRFVEALIGAVYLSKGFNTAVGFTKRIIESNPDYLILFPQTGSVAVGVDR